MLGLGLATTTAAPLNDDPVSFFNKNGSEKWEECCEALGADTGTGIGGVVRGHDLEHKGKPATVSRKT